MSNRWRFRTAYVTLAVLVVAIVVVSGYALLRDAPARTAHAGWWRGLSKPEIAVQVESGRLPVRQDGAGALVPVCFPSGPRLCVVRVVSNNHLLLIYTRVIAHVWVVVHVEDLSAGGTVPSG